MPMISRERVDGLFLEIYDKKPYLRFRNAFTMRFVKAPDVFYMVKVLGAETGGGSEPIAVEAIFAHEFETEKLRKYEPDELITAFEEVERDLEYEAILEVGALFGGDIADMMEQKKRELRLEVEEMRIIRWMHPKRYKEWREMVL